MICYLDASALVKRYVAEEGSKLVTRAMADAAAAATVVVSRAEIVAALAKSVRMGTLETDEALASQQLFRQEWQHLMRLQVTEFLLDRAEAVAWEHGLRGYDAVHLGAALSWRDALEHPVSMMTFDRRLWKAARHQGLIPWPADLPQLLERWSGR